MNKLPLLQTLKDGCIVGLKNFPSLLGTVCLYVLTCWIPYLNVGTTIAICSIPVELSKGHIINPTFIFDGKYRRNMGEFFIIVGLMSMALAPAYALGIIPGIVLSYAWSLAIFLFIDKNATALEALRRSNELTYGYKWRIFGLEILLGLAFAVIVCVFAAIFTALDWEVVGAIVTFILTFLLVPIALGLDAVIYRNLTEEPVAAEDKPADEENVQEAIVEEVKE